jgi:hypothetical protein
MAAKHVGYELDDQMNTIDCIFLLKNQISGSSGRQRTRDLRARGYRDVRDTEVIERAFTDIAFDTVLSTRVQQSRRKASLGPWTTKMS